MYITNISLKHNSMSTSTYYDDRSMCVCVCIYGPVCTRTSLTDGQTN